MNIKRGEFHTRRLAEWCQTVCVDCVLPVIDGPSFSFPHSPLSAGHSDFSNCLVLSEYVGKSFHCRRCALIFPSAQNCLPKFWGECGQPVRHARSDYRQSVEDGYFFVTLVPFPMKTEPFLHGFTPMHRFHSCWIECQRNKETPLQPPCVAVYHDTW